MASFEHRGARIAFDDSGVGPAVLFLHGHPFNRSMWEAQRPAVAAAGWRMIAPDLRGYGETRLAGGNISGTTAMATFLEDQAALLDHLGIGEAVVVGLSMGGQLAMGFAGAFPERVRALVLAATFAQVETPEAKAKRRALADRLEGDEGAAYAAYVEELLPGMLAPETFSRRPDIAAFVERMMRGTDRRGAAAGLRGRAERQGEEAILGAFRKPALIVVGDRDGFTTPADGAAMKVLMPHARLVIAKGAGHMPNLEAQGLFDRELMDFLAGLAEGRP